MEAGPPQGLHQSGHAPPSAQTLLALDSAGVSRSALGLTPLHWSSLSAGFLDFMIWCFMHSWGLFHPPYWTLMV